MKELIWFSIPGAILLFAFGITLPVQNYNLSAEFIAMVIIGIPITGFIIHQLWRTIFELCGGYHLKKRTVIAELMTRYELNNIDAFLLWELTFYSNDIPDSFREHDRGAWHFIMSFSACALASLIAIIVITIIHRGDFLLEGTFLFLFLFVLFILKTHTSLKSLNRQEKAILNIYRSKFDGVKNLMK